AKTQERVAYCLYRASYQSETSDEFTASLESVSQSYRKAAEIFSRLDDKTTKLNVLSNQSMGYFYKSWLIEDPSERKKEIKNCVEGFKAALQACEETRDNTRYGKICNDFLSILYSLFELSFDHIEVKEIIETALDYGLKAIEASKNRDDVYELTRSYYVLSLFLPDRPMDVFESVTKQQEFLQQGMAYAEKAVELSEKVGDPYLIGMSCGVLGHYLLEVKGDTTTAISLARKQLEIGEKLKDRLVLARANEYLSYYLGTWVAADEEDRDKIREATNQGLAYANEAISNYKIILNPILTAFLARNVCPHYISSLQTELELKRKYETDALDASYQDLEYAHKSGSLMGEMYIYHILGRTYLELAKMELDEVEKNQLFNESIRIWDKFIDLAEIAQPYRYWNISVAYNKLIYLRGELAKSEKHLEKKKELLSIATSDIKKSIDLFNTHISAHDVMAYRENFAIAQVIFGEVSFQMHLVSFDNNFLDKAVQYFDDAIETYKKVNMPSNIAEILWKKAWAFYQIRNYSNSAIEFDSASRYYLLAGEKYPNHKEFYEDYCKYMESWGQISRAMDYHSRDEYFLEKEYFERAVQIQTSSERWKYLSPNYLAWARLAEAENHSRNEQCEKAIELFKQSSNLFLSAKESIGDKLLSIGVTNEANMAAALNTASDLRRDYCIGRVAVEEGKILDRRGEHEASSRRYGDAAQIFGGILDAMGSESERSEIRPLHTLCLAWEKMNKAEAEASARIYLEASVLFEVAKEYSPNEKTRLLTMGHSCFCKALSAGIKYEASRGKDHHHELVTQIGSATDFYVRAGYDSALEFSRATQRLFEAYQYMDNARVVINPSEKTRYYLIAETLLVESADAFSKAKHNAKRDEVARLLDNLKQDKELAFSLSKILDTPEISSTTNSFRVPTPSHEYPVGLETFEHADIQAKIFLETTNITSGDEFEIDIELFNTGKGAASIIKIEGLLPDSFRVTKISRYFGVLDNVIDL
ncbi:MAG: hypothetical protein ABIJ47_03605, partial [Candidatus Bathyarchaeota archaeon]